MSIREKVMKAKAPRSKRGTIQAPNAAAAQRIMHDRGIVTAIRDTRAQVGALADEVEKVKSEKLGRMTAIAMRDTAAEAVVKGVADGIATAERKAAREAALRYERDRKKNARKDKCREAHEARVKAADEQRDIAQKYNYDYYVLRHRDWQRSDSKSLLGTLLPTLPPHDLPLSKYVEYYESFADVLISEANSKNASGQKLVDLVYDRLIDEHREQDARATKAYDEAREESEELLERQLAAIDRGETPPQPDADYAMIHNDDGSVTISGRRLKDAAAVAKFFQEEAKAAEFDDDGEHVVMYGLQVPVADIYAHKAEEWMESDDE